MRRRRDPIPIPGQTPTSRRGRAAKKPPSAPPAVLRGRFPFRNARAVAALPSRGRQAAERRRQLVHLASDLIEESGVDAVTLPAVAERAGCARTLVYRYFPSREALLAGVLRDYFERLDARIPESAQRAGVTTLLTAKDGAGQGQSRVLIAAFWETQVAAGLGGAILRAMPPRNPQIEALIEDLRDRYERRVTDPLCDAGLSEIESRVAIDLMITSFVGLALRWRGGEITADQAIDIHARATTGLLQGLLADRSRPAAKRPARRGRPARPAATRARSATR